jgi:TRAP-type C4-dicarboxylate transport system permease small subunit
MKRTLLNLPELCLAALAIAITVAVVGELFLREVFGTSIFGMTSDLIHLFMVWLSMLGAAVAVKRGSHFVFPVVAQLLGPKVGRYLSANLRFIAIPVSLFWEIIALPVSAALMIVYCIVLLRDKIAELRKREAGEGGRD